MSFPVSSHSREIEKCNKRNGRNESQFLDLKLVSRFSRFSCLSFLTVTSWLARTILSSSSTRRRDRFVGVGMTVTHHPLHRSGRAALPHPAPPSGDHAKPHERIR